MLVHALSSIPWGILRTVIQPHSCPLFPSSFPSPELSFDAWHPTTVNFKRNFVPSTIWLENDLDVYEGCDVAGSVSAGGAARPAVAGAGAQRPVIACSLAACPVEIELTRTRPVQAALMAV
ncbi:hypothetical protein EVAR_15700_1 [Eumeta japonica]|uniref:Uncharacterized protein n=1 Tax=Eumeta variegata TaxID=151549 RepID=A0A4C1UAU6_EUMVA|nr:hypothetical protein EVAR_15700_1 [Eumeta japonica]